MACNRGTQSNNAGWCYTGATVDGLCVVVNCESWNITTNSTFFRVENHNGTLGRTVLRSELVRKRSASTGEQLMNCKPCRNWWIFAICSLALIYFLTK